MTSTKHTDTLDTAGKKKSNCGCCPVWSPPDDERDGGTQSSPGMLVRINYPLPQQGCHVIQPTEHAASSEAVTK